MLLPHALPADNGAPSPPLNHVFTTHTQMDSALTELHAAIAAAPASRGGGGADAGGGFLGLLATPQDRRLIRAAAFGSVATADAHALLDVGGRDLAWRYDAFAGAWALMEDEYCLPTRFQALQMKVSWGAGRGG